MVGPSYNGNSTTRPNTQVQHVLTQCPPVIRPNSSNNCLITPAQQPSFPFTPHNPIPTPLLFPVISLSLPCTICATRKVRLPSLLCLSDLQEYNLTFVGISVATLHEQHIGMTPLPVTVPCTPPHHEQANPLTPTKLCKSGFGTISKHHSFTQDAVTKPSYSPSAKVTSSQETISQTYEGHTYHAIASFVSYTSHMMGSSDDLGSGRILGPS